MKYIFLLLTLFFTGGIKGQGNTDDFPFLKKGDSLVSAENHTAAFVFYQDELNSERAIRDSLHRAEIYHRLCLTAEELNRYPEAISYHLKWRSLQPFLNQKHQQQYIDRVINLLPHATDSLGLTRLYYRYGLLLSRETNRVLALNYFLRALDYARGIKNYAAMATISNDIAGEYWDAGQKDLSTQMYKESLEAAVALKDSNRIAGVYMNLAGNYLEEGDFKTGIPMHLEALKIKELLADKSKLGYYYVQTALVYHNARNFEKWEEYVHKAYKIKDCEACTSPMEKAMLYAELGGLAKYKNQIPAAIQYYDTLLNLSKEIAYWNGQKTALDNLALIYNDMGNYTKALEMITQSEDFLTENPYHHISHQNTRAELLFQLGKLQEAFVLLDKNIRNKALSNYASERLRTYSLLYQTNRQLKRYKEAFRWNDSIRVLENLLRDADVRKEMVSLETKYQSEKKEQQISLLTAENKIKNQRIRLSWMFIGLLVVLIVLVLSLLFFRRRQAAFKQSELQQQLLRSQMNPHFIFNVMGSIQSYLYKNEAAKEADYLSRFASLSRSVLEFSSQENITLKEEIDMLQNYIELERAGRSNSFEVSFMIDDDMEMDFIEIPPMLLQPFVENAIKHGLGNIDYPGKLSLRFEEKKDHIAVEIEDNGSGLNNSDNGHHKSKALEIFQQRKKGIEQKFKKELTFEIQNLSTFDQTKQGVRVFIQLPILNND
nr:histidine kinase [Bacteroidota bacterium]